MSDAVETRPVAATDRKVMIITGASAGIGATVAREAVKKGFALVLVARRADRLEELAQEFEAQGCPTLTIATGIEYPGAPERIVAEAIARFGRIDVLVNNAGFGLPHLFAESDPEDINRLYQVNLVAPVLLTRHALPYLVARRGTVINIGSAITAVANPALGAYGSTKIGLAYWNDALRREFYHKGLTVCLVEPGPVKTEFFDAITRIGPEPGSFHAMLDAPYPWMTTRAEIVARRIIRLTDHPRRRISVLRRIIWPFRMIGGFFLIFPAVGDLIVSSIVRHYEGRDSRTVKPGQTHQTAVHSR